MPRREISTGFSSKNQNKQHGAYKKSYSSIIREDFDNQKI